MNIVEKNSPNFALGRGGNTVELIVIHHMAGTIEAADATFQDTNRDTSAHYGVARDGRIWQWVSEDSTAFHAGDWGVNQTSIGIEHEDLAKDDYTDLEYQTSAALIHDICQRYELPINSTTIRPHHDFF
jgi:N-acetyl-anhydromuramyl-L-alanine amidase AmpD